MMLRKNLLFTVSTILSLVVMIYLVESAGGQGHRKAAEALADWGYEQGDIERAIEALQAALQLDPRHDYTEEIRVESVRELLAKLLHMQKRLDEAIEVWIPKRNGIP